MTGGLYSGLRKSNTFHLIFDWCVDKTSRRRNDYKSLVFIHVTTTKMKSPTNIMKTVYQKVQSYKKTNINRFTPTTLACAKVMNKVLNRHSPVVKICDSTFRNTTKKCYHKYELIKAKATTRAPQLPIM